VSINLGLTRMGRKNPHLLDHRCFCGAVSVWESISPRVAVTPVAHKLELLNGRDGALRHPSGCLSV
jgi:hypothetical protein